MKKLLFAMLLVLAGNAYAAKVSITTDQFDGATRIEADPYGTECGWSDLCPMIGARWVSGGNSENAVLIVKLLGNYISITDIKLNIDGQVVELTAFDPHTKFSTIGGTETVPGIMRGIPGIRTSVRDFLIPLHVIDRMLSAQSVKVRMGTDKGLVDSIFSGGKRKVNRGRESLKEFAAAVSVRRTDQPQAMPTSPSAPAAQGNSWWNQQKPMQPEVTRYRCTDVDGNPYVTTTPTKGCVVE